MNSSRSPSEFHWFSITLTTQLLSTLSLTIHNLLKPLLVMVSEAAQDILNSLAVMPGTHHLLTGVLQNHPAYAYDKPSVRGPPLNKAVWDGFPPTASVTPSFVRPLYGFGPFRHTSTNLDRSSELLHFICFPSRCHSTLRGTNSCRYSL